MDRTNVDVVVTGRGALRFETIHANIGLYRMTSATAIRLPQKAIQYGGRSMRPHFSTPYRLLTQVGLAYVVRLRRHFTVMTMFNKVSRREEPEEHKLLKRLESYIFVTYRLSRY